VSEQASWFAEPPVRGFEQRFAVRGSLFRGVSAFQRVEVLDTVPFGRMLTLDEIAQTSEADEYTYHEMLVHPALLQHPSPRRVLVIGGGDGGTLRRVLEHPVEQAVMVEIDELVVRAARQHLPGISDGAFDDPRARLIIGDGARYLRESEERFDAILVDSTDPVGAAEPLFGVEFFRSAQAALAPGGLFVIQSGSPLLQSEELFNTSSRMRQVFPDVRTYLGFVPIYPGVVWSFTMAAGDGELDVADVDTIGRRYRERGLRTRFITPELQRGSFALPPFVSTLLRDGPRAPGHPLPGG